MVLGGTWSWICVPTAGSPPVFVSSTVYSSLSPTWAGLWPLKSITVFVTGGKEGANKSMAVVSTPG